MILYGIKSCDTCRKARKWLGENGKTYQWRDLREQPVDAPRLERWLDELGPGQLINRRSTTWRQLDESTRVKAMDPAAAPSVIARHPTLIKRPVFELADQVIVGFNESTREKL
jgi:arsenate reductase (glutaredoxin)